MTKGCTLEIFKQDGFEALRLSNEVVQLTVVPAWGGKITSLVHRPSGREWLWTNPHLAQQGVVYDGLFVEQFDTGGLDECFPAVAPGPFPDFPWAGITIPDHGELWCQPWEISVVEQSAEQIVVAMTCHGVRFPYRFARLLTITAGSPSVILDYHVTNLSRFDFPFVWCIHPLLKIEEGMRITLPAQIESVHVMGAFNSSLSATGEAVAWPQPETDDNEKMDLARVPGREAQQAFKLYTPPLTGNNVVETAVHDPSGRHACTFRFSPREITHIGVWMNYGAWSGSGSLPYFNLGLEPCIGGHDALSSAREMNEFGLLPAEQSRSWSLELELS